MEYLHASILIDNGLWNTDRCFEKPLRASPVSTRETFCRHGASPEIPRRKDVLASLDSELRL